MLTTLKKCAILISDNADNLRVIIRSWLDKMIKVNGEMLHVDLLAEVEGFLDLNGLRQTDSKIICRSPFREDRSPSFFLNLDSEFKGSWGDSGAHDDDKRSGNFVKLIALLHEISYEEACEYLIEKYSIKSTSKFKLGQILKPRIESESIALFDQITRKELESQRMAHDYLTIRGITDYENVARNSFVTQTDTHVSFIWFNTSGEIVARKVRGINAKTFYIKKPKSVNLNNYLYNLHRVYNEVDNNFNQIWITEGEMDALSVDSYSNGQALGVATGNGSIDQKQVDLILRTGIKSIVLAFDNDKVGERIYHKAEKMFKGKVNLSTVTLGSCKDVNEYVAKFLKLPEYKIIKNFNTRGG